MNEIYQQLVSILYGIWRQRIIAITIAWIISVVGWVFVAQIPDIYQSEVRIHVDAEAFLKPLLGKMAVQNNVYNQVAMMRQTLISRPNIEKVIRMTDQNLLINNDQEMEDKVNDIMDRIKIKIQAANLFSISYSDEDPAMAKNVVDALKNIFMEENLGQNRKDLTSAVRFIDDQISEYEKQLEDSEQRTMEFRQKNMAFLSDKSYFDKFQASISAVTAVQQKLSEYKNRRKQLAENMKNIPTFIPSSGLGPSFRGGGGGSTVSVLQSRINLAESRLDELYARGYKDQHPDVRIALSQIKNLRAKQKKEQVNFSKALQNNDVKALQASGGVTPNPVYDQLSIKMVDLDGELASLKSQLRDKKEEAKKLQAMAHRIPEVEAELTRLNRNYNVLKKNYNQMLVKRGTAKISSDLETNTDRVRFRVIEDAVQAGEPFSPNRLLLVIGVLALGLGGGTFAAFILSQMHTTFSTERKLRDEFPFPVLGCVSILSSPGEIILRKKKLIMFSIMMTGLFVSTLSVYLIMNYMHSISV